MKRIFILFSLAIFISLTQAFGQKKAERKAFTWQAFAGLNLGASTPIPTPKSVKEIYAWYPNSNPSVGVTVLYRFKGSKRHGLGASLLAERKSFSATTRLEGFKIGEGAASTISGNQRTAFEARYLTLPIFYNVSLAKQRINLYTGVYTSLLLKSDFKIILDTAPESLDEKTFIRKRFDNIVSPIDVGFYLGADFFITSYLGFTMRISTGLTSATKDDFAKMSGYNLHNLYTFLGVTYRFKR